MGKHRRCIPAGFYILATLFSSLCAASDRPLTLPWSQRPAWLRDEGIIMAGSWEPLLFRVRRDGGGYEPTPGQRAAYEREHSPEMVAKLKALGVDFVMMHCYKGFGLRAERESMADAKRFAKLCHDAGMHVGVYVYSGTLGWELLFQEWPDAKDWVVLDEKKQPVTYGKAAYRYYVDRNNPAANEYLRKVVRFAVEEIGADLLHFDNYHVGPGREENSLRRYQEYLRGTPLSGERTTARDGNPSPVKAANLADRTWNDFACESLAESYVEMARYARSLRPDILIECNPGGVPDRTRPPVDHARLLRGGEAFWDEGLAPAFRNGEIRSRIRTYKLGRQMDNMVFAYATSPLDAAESMAFNLDCLGCVCWFEYGRVVARPGAKEPVSEPLSSYIRFYRRNREYYRGADVVADVAVLRDYASQTCADPSGAKATYWAEQQLIEQRVPFTIINEATVADLTRYKALVLVGSVALRDDLVARVRDYAGTGGGIVLSDRTARYDGCGQPRPTPALAGLSGRRIVTLPPDRQRDSAEFIAAVRRACGGTFSAELNASTGVAIELTAQHSPVRRMLHIVNYHADSVVEPAQASLSVPDGSRIKDVQLWQPESDSPVRVEFETIASRLTCKLPRIRVYALLIATFAPAQ
jgi:hypothetical protein